MVAPKNLRGNHEFNFKFQKGLSKHLRCTSVVAYKDKVFWAEFDKSISTIVVLWIQKLNTKY